jgi:fimbrial isopeptide formation D2 family protein/LPXTG-motif cell wall-anchored protein
MLKTAGLSSVKVSTKEDVPTLEKKVKADNDNYKITGAWASGVQDAADYDIGDDVPFQLTGSLPTTIKNYSSYQYIFHDTLAAGFTYNNDVQFYYVQDGVWSDITDYTYIYNEKEYKAFTTTVTNKDDGSTSLTFNCNAIRGLVSNAKEGDKIVVRYTAKLTGENVVMGSAGNTNEAWLEYSNNPYNSNTTTETVHDKVTVFTYQVIVNKIRDDEEKTPLTGAEFTLKKQNGSNWETVGTGIKSTDGTVFTFKGLDAGTYRLEETTVPTGYHKADDLTFKIEAKYDITSETPALTQLIAKDSSGNQISGSDTATFAVDLTKGSLTTYIINETGTLLPETGGIGTKIFTVAGIALMLTAGVLLVTRRKMNK